MLLKLIFVFLIFTHEFRCASIHDTDFEEEVAENVKTTRRPVLKRRKSAKITASPTSVVELSSNIFDPVTSANENISKPKPITFLNIGEDLFIKIAEYLEFPHKTLSGLCRYSRIVFSEITPAMIISHRLEIPRMAKLPTCSDLKYLSSLGSNFLKDNKRILYVLADLALVKALPVIKSKVLRLLYYESKPFINREELLNPVHPFQVSHSTIGAILQAAFGERDYELIFDILDNFSELHPQDDFVFCEEFILAAIKLGKTENLFNFYARNIFIQNRFDLACNILSLSFDPEALEWFLQLAYPESDRWNNNYTQTFLNAWIYALVYSSDRIEGSKSVVADNIFAFIQRLPILNCSLNIRRHILMTLIVIRIGKLDQLEAYLHELVSLINASDHLRRGFQNLFENILWALIVEKQYKNFFLFLKESKLNHFESSKLCVEISKIESEDFMIYFIENFNVKLLFGENLIENAVYNKRLFLHLIEVTDEETFLETANLDGTLFLYATEHFKDDLNQWEIFFKCRNRWTIANFIRLLSHLLKSLPDVRVFEKIFELLTKGSIELISLWDHRPFIVFDLKTAEFLLQNEQLHPLLRYLRHFVDLRLENHVMSNLITRNTCKDGDLLKIFEFEVRDLLIQLGHWTEHEKYMKLFGLSETVYLSQLFSVINGLKITYGHSSELDDSILVVFDSILSKLKSEFPLKYLLVVPRSILERSLTGDPILMRRALMSRDWQMICDLFGIIRGRTVKVKGPFIDVISQVTLLIYGIRLNIV